MGTEDVKVTAMNTYKYKERLRLYKRWPCSTYILNSLKYKCYTANVSLTFVKRNLSLYLYMFIAVTLTSSVPTDWHKFSFGHIKREFIRYQPIANIY